MSEREDWAAGWDAGNDYGTAASEADIVEHHGANYTPADVPTPDADSSLNQAAWEDGYVFGVQYAREPISAYARTTNPYA